MMMKERKDTGEGGMKEWKGKRKKETKRQRSKNELLWCFVFRAGEPAGC